MLAAVLSGDKIYGRLIKVEVTAASLDILYMFALVMFRVLRALPLSVFTWNDFPVVPMLHR